MAADDALSSACPPVRSDSRASRRAKPCSDGDNLMWEEKKTRDKEESNSNEKKNVPSFNGLFRLRYGGADRGEINQMVYEAQNGDVSRTKFITRRCAVIEYEPRDVKSSASRNNEPFGRSCRDFSTERGMCYFGSKHSGRNDWTAKPEVL
ncbi:hypothetical protein RRG08_007972 [Elysia crispata]|uniref:Uncharacterized protein n=1 Tax=Elysia crispata TaxID=231223 RepID=A0AAE0ZQA9_9GAST|nr:hypothetical protein RRG08_007972 [Elysia crispata]